jgi:hypothetical protein
MRRARLATESRKSLPVARRKPIGTQRRMVEMVSEKTCLKCGSSEPDVRFRAGRRVCRPCTNQQEQDRVAKKPGGKKAWNQRRYQRDRAGHLRRATAAALALRRDVIGHYGGICVCCGETELRFLTIDHIYEDGAVCRRETNTRGGTRYYYWVKANGYPDFLRVLCYNCNLATYRNGGICPHEEERLKLVA